MSDVRRKRELKHFMKTYKPYVTGRVTMDDLAIAFVKGFNASDMISRGKSTEADEDRFLKQRTDE